MRTRGRNTQGAMDAAGPATQRPEPLSHLTAEQKKVWKRCADSLPPEWFRGETLDLLAEYCEQVSISRKIGKMIRKLPDKDSTNEVEKLVRLKEKTARVIVTLATKMRMSQQSTYDREKVKDSAPPADNPWPTRSAA